MAANELTCLYLLPILHEYRRLYPSVHITVQRALAAACPAQVLDYGADFGVITFRPDTRLAHLDRRLSRRTGVRRAADASAGAAGQGVDRRTGERVVRRASRVVAVPTAGDRDVPGQARVELRMPVEMPTIDAIKKFVAMGNGVALLPAITVERELAHKELGARAGAGAGLRSQAAARLSPRRHAVARRRGVSRRRRSADRAAQRTVCRSPPSARYTYAFLPMGDGPDGPLRSDQACGSGGIGRRASLRS